MSTILKTTRGRADVNSDDWAAWEARNSVTILTRRVSARSTTLELAGDSLTQEEADAAAADLPGTGSVVGL